MTQYVVSDEFSFLITFVGGMWNLIVFKMTYYAKNILHIFFLISIKKQNSKQ